MSDFTNKNLWALIIGDSSGMGLATAKKMASHGMNLFIVHKDRRSVVEKIEKEFDEIRAMGVDLISFNKDGVNPESIQSMVKEIQAHLQTSSGKIKLFLHSVAQGNLKSLLPFVEIENPQNSVDTQIDEFFSSKMEANASFTQLKKQDLDLTLNAMGSSIAEWIQQLVGHDVFTENARVIGLTSEGTQSVWGGYAAVAAAKAVLETLVKYFAVELAPRKITANIIQAGITDTPSLQLIPGSDFLKRYTKKRNPNNRLTLPSDIANVVYLLCREEANWINGSTIIADGGEHLT